MTAGEFLKTAVHDHWVGALTKSSTQTVERVTAAIPSGCSHIVEYGPGDGTLTRAILDQLPSSGQLVAIERNPTFVEELRRIRDPRFSVVHGDVLEVAPRLRTLALPRVDTVVSGIPCTLLKPHEREELVRATHAALVPGGVFVVYQYSPLMYRLLDRYFGDVRLSFAPLNFPPYFVMTAVKGGGE